MQRRWRNLLLLLFGLIWLTSMVSAAGITVTRDAPSTARYGELIRINISITNHFDHTLTVQVEEQVAQADAVDPKPEIPTASSNVIAIRPPHLNWSISLDSGETKSVHYVIQPKTVGWYSLSRTKVIAGNAAFFSNTSTIIITCNANLVCEPDFGENARNCAADCPSGGADNLCNRARDGYCDPDCEPGADLDCLVNNTGGPDKRIGFPVLALPVCLGGLVILAIALAIVYYLTIRKKKENSTHSPSPPTFEPASGRPLQRKKPRPKRRVGRP